MLWFWYQFFYSNVGDHDKKMFSFITFILKIFLKSFLSSNHFHWMGDFFSFHLSFLSLIGFHLESCTLHYRKHNIEQSMFPTQQSYSFIEQICPLIFNCLYVIRIEALKGIQRALRAHESDVLPSFEMKRIDKGRRKWKAIPRHLVSPGSGQP